jgi:hypothetical protein
MKVILDIPDNKASSIMDELKNISFLKIETISASKAAFFKELKSSIDQVTSAKQGKTKLKSADQLLNEL